MSYYRRWGRRTRSILDPGNVPTIQGVNAYVEPSPLGFSDEPELMIEQLSESSDGTEHWIKDTVRVVL